MTALRILAIGEGLDADTAPHLAMPAIWLAHRGHAVRFVGFGRGGRREVTTPLACIPSQFVADQGTHRHVRLALAIADARRQGVDRYLLLGSMVAPAALLALSGIDARHRVYITQDFLEPGRHPLRSWCERMAVSRSAHVITNDPTRARIMASLYGLRTVPPVVRSALPRSWPVPPRQESVRARLLAVLPAVPRRILIMAGGPFAAVRCGPTVIEALALLPPSFAVLFTNAPAGSATRRDGERAAQVAGVRDRVVFLEPCSHADYLSQVAGCDIGLLLYPDDGIGNFCQAPGRLTEYAACGIPVVASRFPSLELPIVRYGLGAVCDATSPRALAAALLEVVPADAAAAARRLIAMARGDLAYETTAAVLEQAVER